MICYNEQIFFILLLHHALCISASLLMDVGLSTSSYPGVINMTALAERLGTDICNSLPGIHAFTGCDFTAAFMHKGKVCPFQLMEKNNFVLSFGRLGESSTTFQNQ